MKRRRSLVRGQDLGQSEDDVNASLSGAPEKSVQRLHSEGGRLVDEGDGGGTDHAQGHRDHEPHEQNHQGVEPAINQPKNKVP